MKSIDQKVKENLFFKATGTYERIGCEQEQRVEQANPESIGKYACNNGRIAFVDENRDYWVSFDTEETRKVVEDAGYGTSVYVPHSNGTDSKFIMDRLSQNMFKRFAQAILQESAKNSQ